MTVPGFTVLAEPHFFQAGQRGTGLAFRMSVSPITVVLRAEVRVDLDL